jgi:hypothetical protein
MANRTECAYSELFASVRLTAKRGDAGEKKPSVKTLKTELTGTAISKIVSEIFI